MIGPLRTYFSEIVIKIHQFSLTKMNVKMTCCLTGPSPYLNQYWLVIGKVQCHLSEGNFSTDTSVINQNLELETYFWNYLWKYVGIGRVTHFCTCKNVHTICSILNIKLLITKAHVKYCIDRQHNYMLVTNIHSINNGIVDKSYLLQGFSRFVIAENNLLVYVFLYCLKVPKYIWWQKTSIV